MVELIFILLLAFQIKHFLADYVWQGKYMLGKFKKTLTFVKIDPRTGFGYDSYKWPWVKPLALHCLVHAVMTLLILLLVGISNPLAIKLAIFDFVVHFIMDRIKASPDILGKYKPNERPFWICLGVDQAVHHLTHYVIIIMALGLL